MEKDDNEDGEGFKETQEPTMQAIENMAVMEEIKLHKEKEAEKKCEREN